MDTFINAIYLYDDKVLITFNYKEGTETVTFGEATEAEKSSDMSARGAPKRHDVSASCLFSLPVSSRRGAQRACRRGSHCGRFSLFFIGLFYGFVNNFVSF